MCVYGGAERMCIDISLALITSRENRVRVRERRGRERERGGRARKEQTREARDHAMITPLGFFVRYNKSTLFIPL